MHRTKQILSFFAREKEFSWGKRDCCLWVVDALKAIHNKDYAEPYRGKYSSELGFKKLLVSLKLDSLEELLLGVFGVPKSGGYATIGNPVMLEEGSQHILGMCYGTYALFLTETGFTRRNLSACKYSWEL